MKNKKLPSIFEYIDFRKFLKDYYDSRKIEEPGFSHSYICFKLGQKKSKTYFGNVISGRRTIGPTFIDRFINLLEFNDDESKYFRALVSYNQTMSPKEKEFFFDQLVRLNRTPRKFIDEKSYEYFKDWRHGAIRSLLDVVDVDSGNYGELQRKLGVPITLSEVRKCITVLQSLGLVRKNDRGFLKPTDKVVSTPDCIKDELIKRYQMACLELGMQAISVSAPNAHRMSTLTLSSSKEAFERIQQRIKQLRSEIRSIVHKDDLKATDVYHINLQVFNLTR